MNLKNIPASEFNQLQCDVLTKLNQNINGTGVYLFKTNDIMEEFQDTMASPYQYDAISKAITASTAGDFILIRGLNTKEVGIDPKNGVNMIWQNTVLESDDTATTPSILVTTASKCLFYGNLVVKRTVADAPALKINHAGADIKFTGPMQFESINSSTFDIELNGVSEFDNVTTSSKGIKVFNGSHTISQNTGAGKSLVSIASGSIYYNNSGQFSTSFLTSGGTINIKDSYLRYCEFQSCDYVITNCKFDDEDTQNQSVIWQDSSNGQLWHSNMNAPVAEYGVYMNTGSFKSRYNVFNVLGSGSPQYCIYDNVGSNANNWYSSSNVGDSGVTGQTVAVGTL